MLDGCLLFIEHIIASQTSGAITICAEPTNDISGDWCGTIAHFKYQTMFTAVCCLCTCRSGQYLWRTRPWVGILVMSSSCCDSRCLRNYWKWSVFMKINGSGKPLNNLRDERNHEPTRRKTADAIRPVLLWLSNEKRRDEQSLNQMFVISLPAKCQHYY